MYNHGISAGAYFSVIGPGKNLQLSTDGIKYYFRWVGPNYGPGTLIFHGESKHPGRLPEPVTLIGPADGDTISTGGALLTSEESENSVGYQLLFGSDPHRVMDYNIVSDTPDPPTEIITELPHDRTFWTVKAYDQFGSTIYADPRLLKKPENIAPVADAGADQSVVVGDTVVLDASASTDPDDDTISYSWSLVSVPPDSFAELSDSNIASPSFIPDQPGEYQVSLVVSDDYTDSEADSVTITAISLEDAAMQTIIEIQNEIVLLDPNSLKNENMANALSNKIDEVLSMVEAANYHAAMQKLAHDILAKTDGCANSGKPDKNDWIKTCPQQNQIYPLIIETIDYLNTLMN